MLLFYFSQKECTPSFKKLIQNFYQNFRIEEKNVFKRQNDLLCVIISKIFQWIRRYYH